MLIAKRYLYTVQVCSVNINQLDLPRAMRVFWHVYKEPSNEGSSLTYFVTRSPLPSESLYRRYPNYSNTQWKPRFIITPVNWTGLEIYAIMQHFP